MSEYEYTIDDEVNRNTATHLRGTDAILAVKPEGDGAFVLTATDATGVAGGPYSAVDKINRDTAQMLIDSDEAILANKPDTEEIYRIEPGTDGELL